MELTEDPHDGPTPADAPVGAARAPYSKPVLRRLGLLRRLTRFSFD